MKCKNVTASELYRPARYEFPVPILRGVVNVLDVSILHEEMA